MDSWDAETLVELGDTAVIDSRIAISDSGVLHVAFATIASDDGVQYGTLTSSGWEFERLGAGSSRGVDLEVVGETPHVVFREGDEVVYLVGR